MNKIISAVLIATALGAAATPASAQVWPTKPVRVVVPFGPGSTPDVVARLVVENLQAKYPAIPFVVDNKAGASGNLGTDAVAKADPDGSTIGVSIGGPLAINTLLFSKLPYDPAKDIAPVTQLITQPSALAVPANAGINSVADLVAAIKNPAKFTYGSIGNGSLSQLAMEAVSQAAGVKLVHVPYQGSPQAMTALLRGDVQVACLPAIAVTPQAAAGQLKILAVSTARRSPYLADVPTLKEAGLNVEADAWMGLIAPGGTPAAIIDAINKDVVEAIRSPAVKEKLAVQLMEPVGNSPAEFRKVIDGEIARWAPVIKAADIKIN